MNSKDLQNILKKFKNLNPRVGFVQELRTELLTLQKKHMPTRAGLPTAELMNVRAIGSAYAVQKSFLQQPFNALAFAIASILVLVGVHAITKELSPLFLPGLNQKGITAEAEMIDKQIDIQLSQIEYFQATSQKSAQVLKEVTEPGLDHLNETLIQNESESVLSTQTEEETIGTSEKNAQHNEDLNAQLQEMLRIVSQ